MAKLSKLRGKGRSSLLLIVTACVCVAARADRLDEVLITADRVVQPLTEVASTVRVLTPENLRSLPARTLGDALATLPNVMVRQSGSSFDESSITMYGISGQPRAPSRTVIAIGGVPLNTGLVPETSLNLLPLGLVQAVELVQGPGSAAYGSNATTGVLNLVPRRPDGWLAEADFSMGSRWDTSGLDFRIGHGQEGEHSWLLGLSRRKTDGHLQPQNRTDFSDSQLDTIAFFGERRFGDIEFDARWLRYDFDRHDPSVLGVGVPPGPTAREEIGHRSHGSIGARWDISTTWSGEVRFTRNGSSVRSAQTFRQPAIGPAAANPANETVTTDGWLAQADWSDGPHRLTAGFEYQEAERTDRIAVRAQSGRIKGAFVQYRRSFWQDRFALSAGYRFDDASTYDRTSSSPKFGAIWRSSDGQLRWRLNAAQAFNAPTFTELFSTAGVRGNPALRAQTLRLAETGLAWNPSGAIETDLSIFKAKLRDPIFPRPNPALGPGVRQFQNVGPGVDTLGATLSASWRVTESWTLGGSYAYLDPGQATFHTARHTTKLQARYAQAKWSLAGAARHEAKRYWRDGFANPASDYLVLDLRASISVGSHLRAEIALFNVTDEDYATTASIGATTSVDLPRPGFNALFMLRATL